MLILSHLPLSVALIEDMSDLPPNILLIVSDQHRRDASGVYGSPVRRRDGSSPTPNIDRLASRGTVFDHAICTSPLCAPSRASFLTGLHPHTTTALYHKMLEREAGLARFPGVRREVATMADHFRAAGYRTGAIGKMHVHGEEVSGWDLGFDVRELRFYTQAPGMHYGDLQNGDLLRRYRELPPYRNKTYREIDPSRYAEAPADLEVADNTLNQHRLETLVEREEDMFDHLVADRSMAFIDDCAEKNRPFFLHVGLEKPHEPWSAHRRYLDLFDPDTIPLPATLEDWKKNGRYPGIPAWQHAARPPEEIRRIIASYYACVAEMDHELGRVIDRCAELGLLENTVIIYTSDHGELLFDHGLIYKHNFFASSVDVPLMAAGPRIPIGRRTSAPASLVDLLPTVLDLAGLPSSPETEGESLREILQEARRTLCPPTAQDPLRPPDTRSGATRPVFCEFHQAGSAAWGPRLHPTRMVRQGDWKYIYTHGMRDQLFDTKSDPDEVQDLAADPRHREILRWLRYLCLRDWELDAHPQLYIKAKRTHGGVELHWESAGQGAAYDEWREPELGEPELLAAGWPDLHFTDASGGAPRYRVVGHPALTRSFANPNHQTRYGPEPVLTAEYPDFLPVTALVALRDNEDIAEARYRPWHTLEIGARSWIYEGIPPSVRNGKLHATGPCAVLTPRFLKENFILRLEDLSMAWKKDTPADEQVLELVFGWDNAACTHAITLDASMIIRLVARRPSLSVLDEVKAGTLSDLTLSREGTKFTLSANRRSVLAQHIPDLPSGRIGINLGLGAAAMNARLVLEK